MPAHSLHLHVGLLPTAVTTLKLTVYCKRKQQRYKRTHTARQHTMKETTKALAAHAPLACGKDRSRNTSGTLLTPERDRLFDGHSTVTPNHTGGSWEIKRNTSKWTVFLEHMHASTQTADKSSTSTT